MSTKDRNEKLAAARKKLKKFQSRKTPSSQPLSSTDHPLLTAPAPLSNFLLTEDPEPVQLTSLTLTTPIDTPITVTNGYTASGWSLPKRPLTSTDPLPSTDLGTLHSHSGYRLDGGPTSLLTDSHTHTAETHKYYQTTQEDVGQLEQHVQVHAQTIDILVSEKTALQSQLSSLHTNLRNKTREVEDLAAHLQSTRQQLEENERIKLSLSEDKAHIERTLSQMSGLKDELEKSLQKMRLALEDTRQENTELISKVTSQASELHSLQEANVELQSKLNMAELLTQQLSAESLSPSSPSNTLSGLTDQLDKLHGEVKRLEGVVRSVSGERDQALGDLDALRDAMIQQQQDSAHRLSDLHSKLVESEAERLSLSEQLQGMRQREDELAQHASTEHAQLQQSAQVAMETLQQEKYELQTQLQSQVEENGRLSQLLEQMELRVAEAESEGARLREAAVDSGSLLDTMSRDKEALSRAVGQNKELKTQLVELQDAFVKMSQQNMDLATELETERFHVAQLQAQRHREEETEVRTEVRTEVATQTEEEEEREEVDGKWTVGDGEVGDGGEVMEVLPESSHLTELLQRMEGERNMLQQQLRTLSEERDGLHQKVSQLQLQISTAANHNDSLQSPSPNDRSSPHDETGGPVAADETQDLLSSLQANFNALQERYVVVMADKAELMETVEQKEVTIGQLSGETETIGEYIMLYQRQREALREKFKEKDNFIQHLISEKASIQSQLGEVQRLMKQLLSERRDHHVTSLPPNSATPPSSPSLPLHLRPLTYHHPHHHTPSPSPSPPPLPPSSSDTVGQIIQLLTVMGEGGESVKDAKVPCACCTGDIITV